MNSHEADYMIQVAVHPDLTKEFQRLILSMTSILDTPLD